jgi:hypothetical protein
MKHVLNILAFQLSGTSHEQFNILAFVRWITTVCQVYEDHMWTTLVISFCCSSIPESYMKTTCLELIV